MPKITANHNLNFRVIKFKRVMQRKVHETKISFDDVPIEITLYRKRSPFKNVNKNGTKSYSKREWVYERRWRLFKHHLRQVFYHPLCHLCFKYHVVFIFYREYCFLEVGIYRCVHCSNAWDTIVNRTCDNQQDKSSLIAQLRRLMKVGNHPSGNTVLGSDHDRQDGSWLGMARPLCTMRYHELRLTECLNSIPLDKCCNTP